MSKREPILDDPETLNRVKEEFAKRYPDAARNINRLESTQRRYAQVLWLGFREGFTYGYWFDEIPLS